MNGGGIHSYLTVTSMGLLGFNTDDYKDHYPGIAMELPPITCKSFDKENEPLLMCCLHFLLTILDYEEFPHDIETFWPYVNVRAKSDFKTAIYTSFERLQYKNVVKLSDKLAPTFWQSNLNIYGLQVWLLLRILSDLCLDMAINTMKPISDPQLQSLQFVNEISTIQSTPSILLETNPLSNGNSRRKSFMQQQTEALESLSKVDSFIVRRSSISEEKLSSRTQLLHYIAEEQRKVEDLMSLYIAKRNRQHAYLQELDQRLRAARICIEKSQKQIEKSIKQEGNLYAITQAGRKERVTKLEKITLSLRNIEKLVHQPEWMETIGKLGIPTNENGNLGIQTTTIGKLENELIIPFAVRLESGKRELLEYGSIDNAVEALQHSVDALNSLYIDSLKH